MIETETCEILTRFDKVDLSCVKGQQTVPRFNDIYGTLSTVIHRLIIQSNVFFFFGFILFVVAVTDTVIEKKKNEERKKKERKKRRERKERYVD